MTNCLKCVYKRGDTAEDRACTKCGRPKNVGKGQWPPLSIVAHTTLPDNATSEEVGRAFAATLSLADMIGEPGPVTQAALACEKAYAAEPTQAAPAAGMPVGYTLADMIGAGETPAENPPLAPARPAGAGSDGFPSPAALILSSAPDVDMPGGELHPTDAGGSTQLAGAASQAASPSNLPALTAMPEHSPKGGSGAKRWMNCKGSYGLIEALRKQGVEVNEESAFAARGTLIHSVAEACLTRDMDVWEIQAEFPGFDPEDGLGTQQYVNYVRSLPGRKSYEQTYHLPQVHKYFYGKLDTVRYTIYPGSDDDIVLEVVDLKAGAGVFVDEVDNYQIKYYLALEIMSDPEFYDDATKVRGTIAQPFVTWADNPIRSWDTTVGEIKRWVAEELLPALEDESSHEFVMGDWCQFCPRAAKLACPAQQAAQDEGADALVFGEFEELSDEELGRRLVMWELNKTYGKALHVEAHARLMDRKTVPGVKLVLSKAERVWKEKMTVEGNETTLEQSAALTFGGNAYTPQKLLSPAQMEKLPGGPTFVSTWAYKPDAGYTIALDGDRRRAVTAKSGSELFANTVKHLDTSSA